MPIPNTTLYLYGGSNEEVKVVYRDRGDEPPPPVWTGKLDDEGRATITVSQAYLIAMGKSGQVILNLHETKATSQMVQLGLASKEQAELTIDGIAGDEVVVNYLNRGEDPPPPIWTGPLGHEGRVTIRVPHAYLIVRSAHGDAILKLHEARPERETVVLGK